MGLISIFAVGAIVAGTSYALFSSQASNNGNTFGAGTLVLSINTATGSSSTPVFNVSGVGPGNTVGPQTFTLKNEGSVDASSVVLSGISVSPTPSSPNLGDKLVLNFYNDTNGNGVNDGPGTDLLIDSQLLTSGTWTNHLLGFGLIAGASHKLFATITFDSSADNTYQGTSALFNLAFQANQ